MDVALTIRSKFPAGARLDFRGTTVPFGFLPEDGSSYSPLEYPRLFAAIGSTYGGDGVVSFKVPDSRGRLDIGSGTGTSLTARVLAAKGGAETHLLVESELPSHGHAATGSHSHGVSDSGHAHTVGLSGGGTSALVDISPLNQVGTKVTDVAYTNISLNQTAATFQNTGSGQAHNNMQPFLVAMKIIKF